AHVTCLTVEGSAAQHTLPALAGRPRGAVLGGAAIIIVPAILDPLGGIAGGVEQSERIGRKASGGDRRLPGIAAALATIGEATADVAAPPISRLGAGTRRVFPFCLARQPIFLAGLLREPCDIALGVTPADVGHRPVAATLAAVLGAVRARAGGGAL